LNTILTCLFTGCEDPQRPKGFENPQWSMRPDVEMLRPLLSSIHDAHVFVFHDELDDGATADFAAESSMPNIRFIRQPTPVGNIYRERWRVYARWLNQHPEVRRVWCVDGTDVVMRHYPFHHMRDGVLYTCSEAKDLSLPWIVNNHRSIEGWLSNPTNRSLPLLNAGLVGGDRSTVWAFLWDMISTELLEADAYEDLTDMGAFNRTAWDRYGERLVFGPRVHTVFTGYEKDNGYSWWSHR
jgi:hypothetical protein